METSAAVAAAVAALVAHGANAADAAATPAMPAAPATPAASVPAPAADSERSRAGEPNVRVTVIDDGRARIEELRVRGQLQKVTVAPKGNAPGYEVLLGDGVHTVAEDPGTSRGSAGKRVWNVLRF
jgi:hypothetical protein